jgi:hypothetical protein
MGVGCVFGSAINLLCILSVFFYLSSVSSLVDLSGERRIYGWARGFE